MTDIETGLVLRLEASLNRFEKQMKKAQQVAGSSTTDIQNKFDRMNSRVSGSAAKAATGLQRIVNISGRGRFVLQNTANQFGDIAVQLQSGAGASRTLGQQLPQLLGGFGALGGTLGIVAPLLGTVAAVGIPVAAMLLRNSESAEKAEEKIASFADKLSDAEGALGRAESALEMASTGGLEDLRKKYGEVTEAVRDLARELYEIEERAARSSVGKALADALGEGFQTDVQSIFGNLAGALVETIDQSGIKEMQAQIAEMEANIQQRKDMGLFVDPGELRVLEQMRAELQAAQGDFQALANISDNLVNPDTAAEVQQLAAGIQEAFDAGNYREAADLTDQLRDRMAGTGNASQEVLDKMTNVESLLREMAKQAEDAKDSVEGIGNVSGGAAAGVKAVAAEALSLANALGVSLQRLQAMQRLGTNAGGLNTPGANTFGGGPNDPAGPNSAAPANPLGADYLDAYFNPPDPKSSGGGGGSASGQSELDTLTTEYERLRGAIDPAWKATQNYLDAVDTLDRALAAGLIGSQEEYNALLADAEAKFLDVSDAAKEMEIVASAIGDAFSSAFDVLLDMTSTAEEKMEALKGIAYDLIQQLLQALVIQPLINGLTGALTGGGFSMPGISFDGGGYTGDGPRSGGLDGKGGYLAMVHPRETVIDHTKGQSAGGQQVKVQQNIYVSAGVAQTVRAEMLSLMPQFKQAGIAAVADEMKRTHRW